jgi:hypothetical protein
MGKAKSAIMNNEQFENFRHPHIQMVGASEKKSKEL